MIRTSLSEEKLKANEAVRAYKRLARVERAFRSLKSVDLHLRPIYHRLPDRVRAHAHTLMAPLFRGFLRFVVASDRG